MKKLVLGLVLFTPSVFVSANDCYDLWYQRNLIFAERGYCFESNLGKEVFKGFECSTHSPKFSADEKKIIDQIKEKEHKLNCNINTALTKTNDSNVSSSSTKVIAEEVTGGISFKDLQLGMNKDAIPSKIKLIKGSKMSSFDDAFKFTDGNNNKIDIYGISFDVSFTIKGDDTVKTIIYTAKEAKNISETTLVELAKLFTSKPLKKMTMNDFGSTNFSHTEINNGVKDDFRVIYYNENAPGTEKNQIIIQLSLESVEAKKAEESAIMDQGINEALNRIYITIIDGGVLCSSVNSYKKLIDYAHKEPGSYSPSDCIQTKESQFAKLTAKESYRGINIIEVMGGENKFYWVSDMFVKRM